MSNRDPNCFMPHIINDCMNQCGSTSFVTNIGFKRFVIKPWNCMGVPPLVPHNPLCFATSSVDPNFEVNINTNEYVYVNVDGSAGFAQVNIVEPAVVQPGDTVQVINYTHGDKPITIVPFTQQGNLIQDPITKQWGTSANFPRPLRYGQGVQWHKGSPGTGWYTGQGDMFIVQPQDMLCK